MINFVNALFLVIFIVIFFICVVCGCAVGLIIVGTFVALSVQVYEKTNIVIGVLFGILMATIFVMLASFVSTIQLPF